MINTAIKGDIKAANTTLFELLSAQYTDLECLLKLAHEESLAAQNQDFERILALVSERTAISDRLNHYQHQFAELSLKLGISMDSLLHSKVAVDTREIIAKIQAQDAQTMPLLTALRNESTHESLRCEQVKRGIKAYAQEGHPLSTAYDRHI